MINDLISRLKNEGASVDFIILELKRRDLDPKAGYRVLRFYFKDQDLEIRQKILEIYALDNEYNFDNPFTHDFLKKI